MRGKSLLCYTVVVLVVCIPFCTCGTPPKPSTYSIIPEERVLMADANGPVFDIYPMNPLDRQYTRESSSLPIPLVLKVDVEDSDLPHTVLARWKISSAETWIESRMHVEMMLSNTSFRMSVHLVDYDFDANHTYAAWDFQFIANDSLGNLGESNVFRLSISVSSNASYELQGIISILENIVIISIAAGVILSFPVILIKKLN